MVFWIRHGSRLHYAIERRSWLDGYHRLFWCGPGFFVLNVLGCQMTHIRDRNSGPGRRSVFGVDRGASLCSVRTGAPVCVYCGPGRRSVFTVDWGAGLYLLWTGAPACV